MKVELNEFRSFGKTTREYMNTRSTVDRLSFASRLIRFDTISVQKKGQSYALA